MHTIRTITGTTACCTITETGSAGARRYTVRAAWIEGDVVVTVEGITGQHVAQRIANRMAEAVTPGALVAELASRDADGTPYGQIPRQDAEIRNAAQIPAGSSGRVIEGTRIDSIGMRADTERQSSASCCLSLAVEP